MTIFKSASKTHGPLQQNPLHQTPMNHAMEIYKTNSIYTFIPKNGCSTLRLSVAIENGCIDGIEQGNWIHANNQTFKPSLADAAKAQYKFVVLRCPYRRLASVFLDKFVAKEPDAWLYRAQLRHEVDLDNLTFTQFIKSLAVPAMKGFNIHWKPQSDFLLYTQYDDYFALEHFSDAIHILSEKINFNVVDARSLTSHGIDIYELLNDRCFSEMKAFDIAILKRAGQCPSHKSLYNPELVAIVKRLYADDIALYCDKCDAEDILFQ
ncbi:sulfotransferase family 2 domain-containing protein [Paraglaciecola sp. MB-3u-78]|jgi:hypothetical protein|uniref:sulfotransferase family 2 domain-containing protein n=1 Tax=Paraglaciecola sp. MB-3u-78 TaxID=2058332 RepID=UPI000C348927|nr:sulfotransferase family 2 domain-containing protein [Paraglaciecola sp. MB-3u-78]PKG95618.1 hypothetical protein CXF95_25780 [Paraglaciecola sp. MB-3u-78]